MFQFTFGTLDLGRGTLVTGALKMASSHSGILQSSICNTSEERYCQLLVTVATVGAG